MMAGKFDNLGEMIKPFLKMMGDNIVTERPRLGGNFAIAQAIFSRSQRDMLREIVGPDLHFMVLSMTKETQDKRLKARHGDSVPEGLLDFFIKFSEKCENNKSVRQWNKKLSKMYTCARQINIFFS